MKKIKLLCLFMLATSVSGIAQSETTEVDHSYKPLKLDLNEDGSKYVRFIIWHQMWMQTGSDQAGFDFSIRRSRFLAYSQISPKFLILTHFGLNSLGADHITANPNSQTENNRSLLFLHGAWTEFAVIPDKLHVGTGLHYWNGISRLTNQSTLNMMTLDNPGAGNSDARLFPWVTITNSDQFARHLGIYAKGSLGNFGYRVSVNNARNNVGTLSNDVPSYQVNNTGYSSDTTNIGAWNFAGYFKYDFFDKESDKLPYLVGTYLGKKKVFSLGFGFYSHPDALAQGTDLQSASRESVSHFAIDAFYDAPLNDKLAINALGAFYNFDYGGSSDFSSGGLVPGSGSVIYAQVGLLLRDYKLMPYLTYNSANLDNTPNTSNEVALGMNYFVNGHFAKITAEYSSGKKGFDGADNTHIFRLQTHIFL